MKRLFIVIAAIAVFSFISYQFMLADRRSRLKVETGKQLQATAASFNYSDQKPDRVSVSGGRMLVYNGSIEFEVDSLQHARDLIRKIVTDLGGYVLSERQDDYAGNVHFTQSLRIPSQATEEVAHRIERIASKVKARRMSAIDVTEEFIDVESRLLTKKKTEARYQEIIKDAKTVEDIMKIEDKITIVRGEIESMEGRLKYLENQVTLGTLELEFYEPGGDAVAGFGNDLSHSFKNGWHGLLSFVAGVTTVWPLIIVVAISVWVFRRRIKKLTFM